MSARIRGEEVTIRITVDGKSQEGSFFKATEWTVRPRQEIVEDDFLGELETDLDFQHHGFDFSFTVQNQDDKALNYLSTIIEREVQHLRHPDIVVTVLYSYREPGATDRVEVYHDAFLKVSELGFKGRKERLTTGFEGKCKKRELINAA